ncbi:hypothetical protein [Hoylesella shahii]|uniref:hypothetical protein n=1 Tax=Hoylesella shahii TaxID=228603 RepID=UPI00248EFE6B|nr:hypothetical protein [Hoylesella shahii]
MALNISIWQTTLVENFYPDNSFAAKSVDDSTFVHAHKVIIPNAGAPSKVQKNRTVKPASVNQRTDNDLEYDIDELTTDPIYIPNIDTVELSYDKRTSVISNDRAQLQDEAHLNLLERWGKGVPASNVLLTTGTTERDAHTSETATGKRKCITKADLLKIMTRMDADNVPEEGRYLLLDAYMYADLLADLSESDKWMFQNSANMQTGVLGNLYGLNIMKRSKVLRVKNDKMLLPWGEDAVAGELAAALAWHEKSVSRALGEVKMFDSTNNPLYYGDIYSFLLRTGGSVRRYDKKGVYLLAEAAK